MNPTDPAPTPRKRFGQVRSPGGEPATRAQIMGLENIERNMGFFAAAIGLVTAALIAPKYLSGKSTFLTTTQKFNAKTGCAKGFAHHVLLCTKQVEQTHAYWTYLFYGSLFMGLLVAFFAWRRNRPGLIVVALLFGLVSGSGGLLFIALAGWLLVRAFRLQRYGVATFKGSNVVARDRARGRGSRATSDAAPGDAPRTPPPSSKRYTPKKGPRR